MEQLTFRLDVFEGPLSLLLHLIAKHKLNIYDVEISKLLSQYLEAIAQMKADDLEVASEFLTMAARLVYIKTVSLLPRHEEEGTELKRELEGQLLEYRLCQEMARLLQIQNANGLYFTRRPQKIPVDKTYQLVHKKEVLRKAYLEAAGRARRRLPPSRAAFSGIVSKRMVSVESRIVFVLKKLYQNQRVSYQEFFLAEDRSEQVATFLAMLELIKSKRICISEDNSYLYFNKSGNTQSSFSEMSADRNDVFPLEQSGESDGKQ